MAQRTKKVLNNTAKTKIGLDGQTPRRSTQTEIVSLTVFQSRG